MNAICTMGAADAALSLPGADTARDLAATSISPNTKRAYGAAFDAREEWLDGAALDDGTLAAYIEHVFRAGGLAQYRIDRRRRGPLPRTGHGDTFAGRSAHRARPDRVPGPGRRPGARPGRRHARG